MVKITEFNAFTIRGTVEIGGAEEAKKKINDFAGEAKKSSGGFKGAFDSMKKSAAEAFHSFKLGNTSLGDLGKALTSGAGMANLMSGAIAGLTTALVNFALNAITQAVASLGQFFQTGKELASDLIEVQNVVDVTFGEGADQINEWAKTSAQAFGLTELQAKKYSSTLGAMLKSMGLTDDAVKNMSVNMAQLAGDMASFYNLDYDVAFEKIRSGISGETEPLKQLGINLSVANLEAFALAEGIEQSYSQMSAGEQAITRYNYLLKATADAQGDYVRTSNSYSNTEKERNNTINTLASTLSGSFLPALANINRIIIGWIERNQPFLEMLSNIAGIIATVLTGLLRSVLSFLGKIADAVNVVLNAINSFLGPLKDHVANGMNDLADLVEKGGKNAQDKVEYTNEQLVKNTEDTFEAMGSAVDKWVNDQVSEYEKKLRDRYNGRELTLQQEMNIAQKVAEERTRIEAKAQEESEKFYASQLQSAEKYQKEITNVIEEETKKQSKAQKENLSFWDKLANPLKYGGLANAFSSKSYASGTLFHSGGLALVGEHGRELVQLERGAKVYNNQQTEQILNNMSNKTESNQFIFNVSFDKVKEWNDFLTMAENAKRIERMGYVKG